MTANLPIEAALKLLMQGNARFINGLKSVETLLNTLNIRHFSENGQKPFCIVVTCSDSRIPIEALFDMGLGQMFVIRNFGNLVDPYSIGSIEYAILNFQPQLLLILGNSRSGAVRITLENEDTDLKETSQNLRQTIEKIRPSLKRARIKENHFGKLEPGSELRERIFQRTCVNNVTNTKNDLLNSSQIIRQHVDQKDLFIVSSLYEMDSGRVLFDLDQEVSRKMDLEAIQSEAKTYDKTIRETFEFSFESIFELRKSG